MLLDLYSLSLTHVSNLSLVLCQILLYKGSIISKESFASATTITGSTDRSNMTTKDSTIDETEYIFQESFTKLIDDVRSLSISYQAEIGKWQLHRYDNISMISITNDYLPEFQNIVESVQELKPPSKEYRIVLDLYAKSIQSEIASHMHFRNFFTNFKIEDRPFN